MTRRAAIVAGSRTPFARSGTVLKNMTAIDLGSLAVRDLMDRSGIPGKEVDRLVYGTVIHDPHVPNIAREVGLATLPATVPAVTVSSACASANQAIADGVSLTHNRAPDPAQWADIVSELREPRAEPGAPLPGIPQRALRGR